MFPHLSFFLTYLVFYLSFPLRIDPVHFQTGCHKRQLKLALVFLCLFCVVVHFFWLVNECLGKRLLNDLFCVVGRKTTTESINHGKSPSVSSCQFCFAIGQIVAEIWRFSSFQNGRHQPFWIRCTHIRLPRKSIWWFLVLCKIWSESANSFKDMHISVICEFGLKNAYSCPFWGFGGKMWKWKLLEDLSL